MSKEECRIQIAGLAGLLFGLFVFALPGKRGSGINRDFGR
jgi:hypothetical protein